MSCFNGANRTEAMLCGVLRAAEAKDGFGELLNALDEKTSGVSKAEVSAWFADHKACDAVADAGKVRLGGYAPTLAPASK